MKECMSDARPRTGNTDRKRQLTFRSLKECRQAYEQFIGGDIEWRGGGEPTTAAPERGGETKAAERERECASRRDPIDEDHDADAAAGPRRP